MVDDKERLWVVVPAHNESRVIADVIGRIRQRHRHVVVVDDGSHDQTARQALSVGAIVLRHPVNLGQGAALQTGIDYALSQGAAYVATFDADGQHDAADLDRMLHALLETGVDVALGSRFLGRTVEVPPLRRLVLQAAVLFTNLTWHSRFTDTHNGMRLFRATAARRLHISQNRMAHASELVGQILRLRLSYIEVPVTISYSAYSLRKGQKLRDSFVILNDLLTGWLSR